MTSISNEIKLTINESNLIFESLSDENSEAKSELAFNTNLKTPLTIGINSKYLMDFLSLIDTEEFLLEINEANTPFLVKSENFTTIIMPITI